MLGKRFRRTTSMSHLGPAAVAPERKQVSLPDAHKITGPFTADHNPNQILQQQQQLQHPQQHLLQQPQIIVEHEDSASFTANNGYGDSCSPHPGLPLCQANTVCVESPTSTLQTHHLNPGSPIVAYNQVGLWPRANTAGAASFPAPIYAEKRAERQILSPVDFLQVCFFCKRRLGLESDIFIYRGDTAFCSEECRHRQIIRDERRSSRKKSTSETVVAA